MITGKYKELYDELLKTIPSGRVYHDPLSTLAFGTDASFYRLIPKLVIFANSEEEVCTINRLAHKYNIAVTYRAAGTSLSGQAISDSILVFATHGWEKHQVLDNGLKIRLQPGVRGYRANGYLLKYGRKIGPDPASIDSAMIGGIAANNASGMCCGTSENSYKTVSDIRLVIADGTVLDTSSEQSRRDFLNSHSHIIKGLESLSSEVNANIELSEKIRRKFKMKNTTGYSLNALTDYNDGFEILKHLIIGSEGTLGFISYITYNTVIEHPEKALALIIFKSVEDACNAVINLKKMPVSAVEIMDRANIRSVEDYKGVPEYLKTIGDRACALLVESRAANRPDLDKNLVEIKESISDIPVELPYEFTYDKKEQAILWKIRKESFPTVAGMRKSGNTPIIEDICFPVPKLAEATLALQKLFIKHGYDDAVIFGHALEGNLHFVFNQDFGVESEVKRYEEFMDDVASLVVDVYDGSLKAEHGTGRNMAPYVEKEWGKEAYELMKKIKNLLDPGNILNPGVILNDDKKVHIKNLKPVPAIREVADKCMECGFCEGVCVSEGFTLSPRQRVATYREIERLKKTGQEPHLAAEMYKRYQYMALDSCATDSLCYVKCPVKVDTGKLVKELRHEAHSDFQERIAAKIAANMSFVTAFLRLALKAVHFIRLIFGKKIFGAVAGMVRKISFGTIPPWHQYFPSGSSKTWKNQKISEKAGSADNLKVVYFPSCITRSMGISKEYSEQGQLTEVVEVLLKRAGYEIIYPENLNSLCCGMAFSSKGFTKAGMESSQKLERALTSASQNGKYPVLCDMSPCLYTMKSNFGERLKLYEPAEFTVKFLSDKLKFNKLERRVAVFAVCSAKKMEVDNYLVEIANKCATEVVVNDTNCCGFAGDRGFLLPELNKHGLRFLREQSKDCSEGYATSRTCEIGLSHHSGISYKSIIYLAEEASR